ncbi:MAG: DUF748 domain-containing protein, partial [Gammaproteobacteria bacterium]
ATSETEAAPESALRPWLDYRRKRFWAVLAVVLYTLAGFFLVPWVVERTARGTFAETGRSFTVEKIRANPYLFTLELEGAGLEDTDGVVILSLADFLVDFQLSSLFRWAWTFKTIRVSGLEMFEERFDTLDTRYLRLIEDLSPPAEEPPAETTDEGPPRLVVHDFQFLDGRLRVLDRTAGDFAAEFGPISVSMQDLQTLPDRTGAQTATIQTTAGGTIQWQGDIQTVPFASRGSVTVQGRGLADPFRYADYFLPFRVEGAGVDMRFDYEVALGEQGLTAAVTGLETFAEGLQVIEDGADAPVIATTGIRLSGGDLRWPEQTVRAQSLTIEGLTVDAALEADGSISLLRLLPATEASEDTGAPAEGASDDGGNAGAWQVALDRLELPDARIALEDRTLSPALALSLDPLRLLVTGLDNQPDTAMPLELDLDLSSGGSVAYRGEVTALPDPRTSGKIELAGIDLKVIQPYLERYARVRIDSGALDLQADLVHGPEQPLQLQGALGLAELEVADTAQNERLLGWSALALDRFEADLAEQRVATSELEFTGLFGRVHIAEDLSTNIGGLLVETAQEAPADDAPDTAAAPLPSVTLGGIELTDAALDFSDFSLPLPFETAIRELEGAISTLATETTVPAAVNLEGRVNEYGSARIEGEINAWSPTDLTHIDMTFRNLDMSRLSPYTVQFAGYRIDGGRIDLDLGYRIDNKLLKGENSIVIREIELGEKVEHPDAGSLPLGLAIALLTNAEGVIDLDLPVEGDLENPEFRIGSVIWQAIGNLITKVVTAPFRFLGALVGMDSEDFGILEFKPGSADVSPPDREKLVKLGEAMLQRPELAIRIGGVYAQALDRRALAEQAVAAAIEAHGESDDAAAELSTERQRRAVEALFQEAFPAVTLESVQAQHRLPAAEGEDPAETALDETAYVAALRQRLVEAQPISEAQLEALGQARAQAAMDVLTASQPDATLDVVLGDTQAVEPAESGGISLELEVTVGESVAAADAEQD